MVQAGSTARVVQAVRDDWPRTGVLADLGGGRPVHLRRRADAGALRLKNRRLPEKRGGRLPPCGQHAAHLVADGRAAVRHTIGSPHHAFRSRTPGDASTISAWASVRWRAVAYVWVTVLRGGMGGGEHGDGGGHCPGLGPDHACWSAHGGAHAKGGASVELWNNETLRSCG